MLSLVPFLLFSIAQGKNVMDVLKNRATYSQVLEMSFKNNKILNACLHMMIYG
jgi:hypothetical protein